MSKDLTDEQLLDANPFSVTVVVGCRILSTYDTLNDSIKLCLQKNGQEAYLTVPKEEQPLLSEFIKKVKYEKES